MTHGWSGSHCVDSIHGPDGSRLSKTIGGNTTLYIGDDVEIAPGGAVSVWPHADVHKTGAALTWLHRDHLSSVRRITDATGALTRASVYQPYGKQTETVVVASPTEPKGYIGERTDPETGLTYLHARFYDPALGRFMSPDWWDVTDPSVGTNRYAHAGGDPIGGSDPSGHDGACTAGDNVCLLFAAVAGRALTGVATVSVVAVGAGAVAMVLLAPSQLATKMNDECSPSSMCASTPSQFDQGGILTAAQSGEGKSRAGPVTSDTESTAPGSTGETATPKAPDVPPGLIGVQERDARMIGGRWKSGPLDPAQGGTGNAEKDFEKLTGGHYSNPPPNSTFPPGTKIGDNGIIFRPGGVDGGPRIDIPENSTKPRETLHYP